MAKMFGQLATVRSFSGVGCVARSGIEFSLSANEKSLSL